MKALLANIVADCSASGAVSSSSTSQELTVSHERFHGNLFFPLPPKPMGVTLIPRLDVFVENRSYSAPFSADDPLLATFHLRTLSIGGLATGEFGDSKSHSWFVTLSRYGEIGFQTPSGDMWESYIGVRLSKGLHLFNPRMGDAYLLFRYRRFPDGNRFRREIAMRRARRGKIEKSPEAGRRGLFSILTKAQPTQRDCSRNGFPASH